MCFKNKMEGYVMSNRKSKIVKQRTKQRGEKERKARIKELQELREKAIQLEKKINEQKKENFKQFNLRNIKFFRHTCNFLAPFVISTGLVTGIFKLFGGGLPFHIDEIKKYKAYSLDYQTNGYVTMEEYYKLNRWFDASLPSNELIIYTPWEYRDNQYIRYKRSYNIGKIDTLDLFNAVLDEDYNYIAENLKEYDEETQFTNNIEDNEGQYYFFEASLHMLDQEDTFRHPETDLQNIIATSITLVLGLTIGGAIAHYRNFNYSDSLKNTNQDYLNRIRAIKPMQEELATTNEKILSLSRKKEGPTNEQ